MQLKLFVYLALLSSMSISAFAAGPSVLATGEDYPPYADKNTKGKGLSVLFIEAILKEAGIAYTIDYAGWQRAEGLTKTGQFIAAFPYMETEKRKADYRFSDPLHTLQSKLFVKSDSTITDTTENSLKGKKICKPKGYDYVSKIQKMIDAKILEPRDAGDMIGCFKLLDDNKLDMISESELIGNLTLNKPELVKIKDHFKVLPTVIEETELRLLVTKAKKDANGNDVDEFLNKFNAALTKLKGSGALKAIEDNFN